MVFAQTAIYLFSAPQYIYIHQRSLLNVWNAKIQILRRAISNVKKITNCEK